MDEVLFNTNSIPMRGREIRDGENFNPSERVRTKVECTRM